MPPNVQKLQIYIFWIVVVGRLDQKCQGWFFFLSQPCPTPSGDYPLYRTRNFHITFDDSTTTHPLSFRNSIRSRGSGSSDNFISHKPLITSRPTPQAARSGAQDRNHKRKTAFSKQAAPQFPPPRPWDCAIDLLPGATLPKVRVYPLSIPERKAMEDYPGAQGNGGLHQGGSPTRINPPFHLAGCLELLLLGQERRRPVTLHPLLLAQKGPTLLGSLHASPGFGCPGSQCTLSLIRALYLWPGMSPNSSADAQSVPSPHHLPARKLVPLPIPHRPWSHVRVDFATDFPNSEGFTCILVAVDRGCKACKLIPLRGLPTALFHHVFRNYGISEDIASDRGPQLTSHVWKAFLKLLGISVSLS